ncbi:hypothetical protein KM043_015523 [Ampulex compressa]|nr:hypothetical protein KM043_015523 [Ampulex compressa]
MFPAVVVAPVARVEGTTRWRGFPAKFIQRLALDEIPARTGRRSESEKGELFARGNALTQLGTLSSSFFPGRSLVCSLEEKIAPENLKGLAPSFRVKRRIRSHRPPRRGRTAWPPAREENSVKQLALGSVGSSGGQYWSDPDQHLVHLQGRASRSLHAGGPSRGSVTSSRLPQRRRREGEGEGGAGAGVREQNPLGSSRRKASVARRGGAAAGSLLALSIPVGSAWRAVDAASGGRKETSEKEKRLSPPPPPHFLRPRRRYAPRATPAPRGRLRGGAAATRGSPSPVHPSGAHPTTGLRAPPPPPLATAPLPGPPRSPHSVLGVTAYSTELEERDHLPAASLCHRTSSTRRGYSSFWSPRGQHPLVACPPPRGPPSSSDVRCQPHSEYGIYARDDSYGSRERIGIHPRRSLSHRPARTEGIPARGETSCDRDDDDDKDEDEDNGDDDDDDDDTTTVTEKFLVDDVGSPCTRGLPGEFEIPLGAASDGSQNPACGVADQFFPAVLNERPVRYRSLLRARYAL